MSPSHPTRGSLVALLFSSLRGAGIQRVMLNLADGFLARGLNVDLVIVDARGELEPVVPKEARVFDLQARRSFHSLPGIVKYLRDRRPAAMLASQTHLNLLAIWARMWGRVPTRLVLSEHIALDAASRNASSWKERCFLVGARLFYRKADGVIVVSHATARRFAAATGLPASMARVIHNPVVTPGLLAQAAAHLDHPWFAPGEPPVILSAGRLTRQKDHETLLRGFALLRERIRARLIILGEGEERGNLERLTGQLSLREDVQLPGFTLNPFAYMARSRLFVLSSRWEGFGNVLAEAMACGAPVISTDCPSGPAEILQNGFFGKLFPVGDAPALASAMLETLTLPPDPDLLKTRALQFAPDHAVQQYLDALLP